MERVSAAGGLLFAEGVRELSLIHISSITLTKGADSADFEAGDVITFPVKVWNDSVTGDANGYTTLTLKITLE